MTSHSQLSNVVTAAGQSRFLLMSEGAFIQTAQAPLNTVKAGTQK